MKAVKYILASASPRRRELLEQIGMEFEVVPAHGEEEIRFEEPEKAVMDLSWQKADEIAKRRRQEGHKGELVIGADTIVVFEGRILGKPKDAGDAFLMLSALQGKRHKVFTGVTFIFWEGGLKKEHSFFEQTEVAMYPMSEAELRRYVLTGEPLDKAGGYGIQGGCAVFIKEIRGDYNNVVGLPVAGVYQELKRLGIDVYEKVRADHGEEASCGNV